MRQFDVGEGHVNFHSRTEFHAMPMVVPLAREAPFGGGNRAGSGGLPHLAHRQFDARRGVET